MSWMPASDGCWLFTGRARGRNCRASLMLQRRMPGSSSSNAGRGHVKTSRLSDSSAFPERMPFRIFEDRIFKKTGELETFSASQLVCSIIALFTKRVILMLLETKLSIVPFQSNMTNSEIS